MSASALAQEALREAVRLGIIGTLARTLGAIVTGKSTLAARLAANDALAAGAKLAAERRIKARK